MALHLEIVRVITMLCAFVIILLVGFQCLILSRGRDIIGLLCLRTLWLLVLAALALH